MHVSVMSGLFSETLQNATFELVHVTWVVARGARREDREEGKRQWFEAIKHTSIVSWVNPFPAQLVELLHFGECAPYFRCYSLLGF